MTKNLLKIRKNEILNKIYNYSFKYKTIGEKYLFDRRISFRNNVSYLPKLKVSKLMEVAGCSREELEKIGFVFNGHEYSFLRGLLLPHIDHFDNVNSMVFRSNNTTGRRYFNTKGAFQIPYNFEKADFNKDVYVTEGGIDCLSAIEMGFKNVVATPTCNISKQMYNSFQFFKKNIYLIFDTDSAGLNGMVNVYKTMTSEGFDNVSFIVLNMPDKLFDLNDCLKAGFKKKDILGFIQSPVNVTPPKVLPPLQEIDKRIKRYYNREVSLVRLVESLTSKDGVHYKCPFPKHSGEKEGSLYIYEGQNSFQCLGCKKGGYVWDFAKNMVEDPDDVKSIIEWLKENTGR
jgi:hypothetical protein